MSRVNEFGQRIGPEVPGWNERALPGRVVLQGRYCRVEPLDAQKHSGDLFEADALEEDGSSWTYLFTEPITSFPDYQAWCSAAATSTDRIYYAVIDSKTERAVGRACYMRIDPKVGSLEVADIKFSPALKRRPAATESMYLMMRYAFDDLGYRRYEWKCDNFNEPSKAAALRYGFSFEGVFRQATIYKGRSRDTAWSSIIDSEWPGIKAALERWLSPDNFDAVGQQRVALSELMKAAR